MTDINKELDEIIRNSLDLRVDEGQAYIHDTDQAIAKIKALVVESLGEDDTYNEMCEHCNNWDEGRNDLRGEIRSIWNTK